VDLGLRSATLDVDYVAASENPRALQEFERLLPRLKDEIDVNVEPASPGDFMPVPRGVLERSRYVRNYGSVAVYHYHYPTLILAKAARGAERDLADIELLLRAGIVHWAAVEETWADIRTRDTGWLRHTPAQVEQRLNAVRRRLQELGILEDARPST
jgi:hypothetical protein